MLHSSGMRGVCGIDLSTELAFLWNANPHLLVPSFPRLLKNYLLIIFADYKN